MQLLPATAAKKTTCPRLWAEIDLGAVLFNYRAIRRFVGPGVRMMAMVKSNAYGHGVTRIAQFLEEAGADCFGVANLEEALELQHAGISRAIVITGPITECEVEHAVANNIQITVSPPEIIDLVEQEARDQQTTARLHLQVDIGMTRAGVPPDAATELAARIEVSDALDLVGVATHFPVAEDAATSREQLRDFDTLCARLADLELLPHVRHVANTMGIFNVPESHHELVRPGIGLFGMYPDDALRPHVKLRPAMTVCTQIVYLRDVPPGTPVGYGHTHATNRHTTIATLPIGYADGFQRSLSNRAKVIVAGRYAPVVGNVSMDMLTIDVGHIPGLRIGMPVTIIGADGDAGISAEEHARDRGTIPYEVVCSVGKRVKRMYLNYEL